MPYGHTLPQVTGPGRILASDRVKIYDASGHTERRFGQSDSIPFALAP